MSAPGNNKENGGEGGKKEEGREKEREREKKGKEGRKREGEGKGVESDKKCKFNKIGSNSTFLDAKGDF